MHHPALPPYPNKNCKTPNLLRNTVTAQVRGKQKECVGVPFAGFEAGENGTRDLDKSEI